MRTARAIASASIPAQARSSSGCTDPGMSVTASLITREVEGIPSASAEHLVAEAPLDPVILDHESKPVSAAA